MKRYANYLAGIGYAAIFGFSFLVTKGALAALDPFELLFMRFAVAAILMTFLLALRAVKVDYRGKPKRDLVLACLFQPVIYFVCETFGVNESASSTAGIVLGALPAAVAVLGIFMLNERIHPLQALSLLLSVLGVAVVVLWGGAVGGVAGSLRGFLFLVGAVAAATFFNIYSRRSSRSFSPVETTYAMMVTGALTFGLVAVVKALATGRLLGAAGILARAAPAWGGILYLGALSSVLAFFLVNFTLSRLKASQSVVFANLTTVVSVAAGVLIRGEPFGPAQLAGSAMIVLGVWGTNAFGMRKLAGGAH